MPRGLPRMEVGPAEERLVGEHLLEVGHEPAGVRRVAAEAAHQMVVDAAGGHGVERPQRHATGRAPRRCPRAAWRRHSSTRVGRGNFGAGPYPPHSVEAGAEPGDDLAEHGAGVERSGPRRVRQKRCGAGTRHGTVHTARLVLSSASRASPGRIVHEALGQPQLLAHGTHQRIGLRQDLLPLADPRLAQGLDDPAERRRAVTLDGGKYVPA